MNARERRIAANEALFRDTNERIARHDATTHADLEILCECGDRECLERISVTVAEYEEARSDPTLFLAKPGHLKADAEQVLAEHAGHQLIQKTGEAAIVAEERDPRS
jgi:hypothetical protein